MRKLWTTVVAAGLVVGLAIPALASHTHVRMTGNGSCVILAANGGEDEVQLPHADEFAADRRHPLHVNVHLGQAGTRQGDTVVWVSGSAGDIANCDGYVND
jgi:hypothetical protein